MTLTHNLTKQKEIWKLLIDIYNEKFNAIFM